MTAAEHSALAGRSILLYDGVCGLCNHVVRLFLRLDRAEVLLFVPLESSLGQELLGPFPALPSNAEGVVLLTHALTQQAAVYRRADGVRESFRALGGSCWLFGTLLGFVPRFVREWGYEIVASRRYRVFGKFDSCPIPTEKQRSRILGV